MSTNRINHKMLLSTLWIFALLNYLYCDVLTLMDSEVLKEILSGTVGGMKMDENFLLGAAILMEIPIVMVLLSRLLKYRANRIANIISGSIMTLVQIATLVMSPPAKYYLFNSIIEIATTICVVWLAVKWKNEE